MWNLILSLCAVAAAATSSLDGALLEHGVHADLDAKVLKDQHLSGETKKQHLIEAETADHQRFEVKIISPVEPRMAGQLIGEEINGLKKLFAAADTPYMGDIAQALGGCPAQFGPIEKQIEFLNPGAKVLIGSANDKFGFGACSAQTAKYRAAYVAYYDEGTKSVWTWRIFVPWKGKTPLKTDWLSPVLRHFKNETNSNRL